MASDSGSAISTNATLSNIYLIGMMGSGKSTVGKALAQLMHAKFVDMDSMIEEKTGSTIRMIFEQRGEDKFRALEAEVLLELSQQSGLVVATGGGTPCYHDNISVMNSTGTTVYLNTTDQVLVDRLSDHTDTRPLLDHHQDDLGRRISTLLESRQGVYMQATVIISTDDSAVDEVANSILWRVTSV